MVLPAPEQRPGEMRVAHVPDDQAVYDCAYLWPHFTSEYVRVWGGRPWAPSCETACGHAAQPFLLSRARRRRYNQMLNYSTMIFTASKMAGQAGKDDARAPLWPYVPLCPYVRPPSYPRLSLRLGACARQGSGGADAPVCLCPDSGCVTCGLLRAAWLRVYLL